MKLDIVVNKYLLMWYLLFQSSISNDIHALKQEIWTSKRKKYIDLQKEKELILKDLDNYIPDDDDVFDDIEKSLSYKKLKQETNRYRLLLLEIWDKNKRRYLKELEKVLKYDIKGNYTVCILHPSLDVAEVTFNDNNTVITMGKKLSQKDKDDFLTYLIYKIVKNDLLNIDTKETSILNAIIELSITNELYTRVTNESKYNLGKKELRGLKARIYPYFLMYLGVLPKDMEKYMVRDNIFFNVSAYQYNDKLKEKDIFEFIDFIIENKKTIFNVKKEQTDIIEQL